MKKNILNKATAFALILGMTLSTTAIPTFSASAIPNVTLSGDLINNQNIITADGINYNIISSPSVTTPGSVVVTASPNLNKIDVVIPATISVYNKTYTVTGIEDGAFSSNKNIKSVQIGKNVSTVSAYAFLDCPNISTINVEVGSKFLSVVNNVLYSYNKDKLIYVPVLNQATYYQIPETVTEIGDCAFYSNSKVNEVSLNTGLLKIGNYAFNNCSALTKVNTSNTVTEIGNYAFAQTNISSVLLSRALTSLGEGAFLGTEISTITIPAGVTVIEPNTFYNCFNLKGIKLNSALEEIGDYAFANSGLLSITLTDNIKTIGYAAFADCDNLAKVTTNIRLKTIKSNAFSNCDSLLSFNIPATTVEIGDNVFTGCNHLATINVSGNNTVFEEKDGILYTKDLKKLIRYPAANTLTTYTLPYQTEDIAVNALADCNYLNNFEVESANKFYLAEDGVLFTMNKEMLVAYPSAKISNNYTIPDYVVKIMPRAFSGALIQNSINISSYVQEIGEGAFDNCNLISSFYVSDRNQQFTSINGVLYSKDGSTLVSYPSASSNKAYTLPENVVNISEGAFKNNSKLKTLTLNQGLISIGKEAFYGTSLSEIVLPETLTTIGESAFEKCSLSSIIIPENVDTIGNFAFANCSLLSFITFNSSKELKNPGYNIFVGTKLDKIKVPASAKQIYFRLFTITDGESYSNIITNI